MNENKSANATAPRMNGIVFALTVVVLVVAAFLVARHYFGPSGVFTARQETTMTTTTPAIGGPFTLVNQHGETVTDADFRGQYMLVYFGYTFCPDICPTSLNRDSEAIDLLGEQAEKIVPVFITVDPERDAVAHMKEYATFFHPRLVALTGTNDQVAGAAKAYRVYYAKVEEEGSDPDSYLMDHTAFTYLMGPDGLFLQHFSYDASADTVADGLRKILDETGG